MVHRFCRGCGRVRFDNNPSEYCFLCRQGSVDSPAPDPRRFWRVLWEDLVIEIVSPVIVFYRTVWRALRKEK